MECFLVSFVRNNWELCGPVSDMAGVNRPDGYNSPLEYPNHTDFYVKKRDRARERKKKKTTMELCQTILI